MFDQELHSPPSESRRARNVLILSPATYRRSAHAQKVGKLLLFKMPLKERFDSKRKCRRLFWIEGFKRCSKQKTSPLLDCRQFFARSDEFRRVSLMRHRLSQHPATRDLSALWTPGA